MNKWESIINAYGELEGFMCSCGLEAMTAYEYCPGCGKNMYSQVERNTNMKICELKINTCTDRADLVAILAFAGYKVSIDKRKRPRKPYEMSTSDYFIIVEEREQDHDD